MSREIPLAKDARVHDSNCSGQPHFIHDLRGRIGMDIPRESESPGKITYKGLIVCLVFPSNVLSGPPDVPANFHLTWETSRSTKAPVGHLRLVESVEGGPSRRA